LCRRSYAAYLLHMPVLGETFELARQSAPIVSSWLDVPLLCAALAIACGLAELSWRVLERGLIAFGHGLRYETPIAFATNTNARTQTGG
jgi:peptidoglycan/LPS O-acetylase OafA/YrhL